MIREASMVMVPQLNTPMKFPILSLLLLLLCPVSGMTEAEFDALYKRLDKDADTCYRLYEAYRDGDGVEQDATKARKWLLGALAQGKPVDDEVARQPWRKKAKLPLSIKPHGKYTEEEKHASSQKICDMLHSKSDHFTITQDRKQFDKQVETAVRNCLNQGAYPNYTAGPHTPLSRAIDGNHAMLKVSRILLEAGGDLHANGNICLEAAEHSALRTRKTKNVVKHPKTHFGYREPAEEVFKFVLKHGLDVHLIDGYGRPVLMSAMRSSRTFWLEELCKAGADPNVKASKYEIAGKVDPKSYYNQIFHILDGETPLLHAVRNCMDETVEVLLRYGADPTLANDAGVKPLELAKESLATNTYESNVPKLKNIIALLEKAIEEQPQQPVKASGKKKKKRRKA